MAVSKGGAKYRVEKTLTSVAFWLDHSDGICVTSSLVIWKSSPCLTKSTFLSPILWWKCYLDHILYIALISCSVISLFLRKSSQSAGFLVFHFKINISTKPPFLLSILYVDCGLNMSVLEITSPFGSRIL